jgi:hypothetical protein
MPDFQSPKRVLGIKNPMLKIRKPVLRDLLDVVLGLFWMALGACTSHLATTPQRSTV